VLWPQEPFVQPLLQTTRPRSLSSHSSLSRLPGHLFLASCERLYSAPRAGSWLPTSLLKPPQQFPQHSVLPCGSESVQLPGKEVNGQRCEWAALLRAHGLQNLFRFSSPCQLHDQHCCGDTRGELFLALREIMCFFFF
jgi:hypothetical protein